MRLFRLGTLLKNGKLGIRLVACYTWNPFKKWFVFRRMGYVRFLRLPGIRFTFVVNKKDLFKDTQIPS